MTRLHPRLAVLLLAGAILADGCRLGAPLTLEPATPRPFSSQAAAGAVGARADNVLTLPTDQRSLNFAVLGDFGTGEPPQYALGKRMADVYGRFPFDLVILVGDNLYGSDRPQDYARKFERPYQALLSAGVPFYAALGNHDSREQRFYEKFNMKGELFYTFKAPKQDVRFFALESTYLTPEQLRWLERQLASAREDWKIVFFHHPLYSSGGTHGSDPELRAVLEPLFVKYGVSVVFTGHDHFYERTYPQRGGITYFVAGSGGKLRRGDARRRQPFSAKVSDDQLVFLAAEIGGDAMAFNAIDATGHVVDAGCLARPGTREAKRDAKSEGTSEPKAGVCMPPAAAEVHP